MTTTVSPERIATVRSFNRFITRHIGVLGERMFQSEFTLTELRVLYELAHHCDFEQASLCRDLGLDRGYLSRIVGRFKNLGLVSEAPSVKNRRAKILRLTEYGRAVYAPLDSRSVKEVGDMLSCFDDAEQLRILNAMDTLKELLGTQEDTTESRGLVLRTHNSADLTWITRRHGDVYVRQQGWDASFEVLVGQICADFERRFDASLDRCWIAEIHGRPVGSIAVTHCDEVHVAKLRLLLVEEAARGHGLGARLVNQCHQFARSAGYRLIRLWTTDQQKEARNLYRSKGYVLVAEEPVHAFGKSMINETWELVL